MRQWPGLVVASSNLFVLRAYGIPIYLCNICWFVSLCLSISSYILFSHLFLTLKSDSIFLRIDSWSESSLYQLVEVVVNFIKAISKIYRIIRRLRMLVLICVKDVGVLRIQPYKLAPKGVPRQHPLRSRY